MRNPPIMQLADSSSSVSDRLMLVKRHRRPFTVSMSYTHIQNRYIAQKSEITSDSAAAHRHFQSPGKTKIEREVSCVHHKWASRHKIENGCSIVDVKFPLQIQQMLWKCQNPEKIIETPESLRFQNPQPLPNCNAKHSLACSQLNIPTKMSLNLHTLYNVQDWCALDK